MPLTPKQEKFAREYVKTGIATEAYRRAYDTNGTVMTQIKEAQRLVAHPHIAPFIKELKQKKMDKFEIDKEFVTNLVFDALSEAKKANSARETADITLKCVDRLMSLYDLSDEKKNDRVPLTMEDKQRIKESIERKVLDVTPEEHEDE